MSGGWGTPTFMGGEPSPGQTYVWGRDPQTARDLLAAAEALGLDVIEVRAVGDGFIVPTSVWDYTQEHRQPDDETGI